MTLPRSPGPRRTAPTSIDRVASRAYQGAEAADEIQQATIQEMFADGVDIAAAVLAILVVLRLTRMQDERARGGPVPVTL